MSFFSLIDFSLLVHFHAIFFAPYYFDLSRNILKSSFSQYAPSTRSRSPKERISSWAKIRHFFLLSFSLMSSFSLIYVNSSPQWIWGSCSPWSDPPPTRFILVDQNQSHYFTIQPITLKGRGFSFERDQWKAPDELTDIILTLEVTAAHWSRPVYEEILIVREPDPRERKIRGRRISVPALVRRSETGEERLEGPSSFGCGSSCSCCCGYFKGSSSCFRSRLVSCLMS